MTKADFWDKGTHFAWQVTDEVGARLMGAFGNATAEEKADGSLVTKYDKWADRELCDRIAKTFPEHGILSEEAEQSGAAMLFVSHDSALAPLFDRAVDLSEINGAGAGAA